MPISEFELVKNMHTKVPQNRQMFIEIYRTAIELLTGDGKGKIGDLQLKKNNNIGNKGSEGKNEYYVWNVVDYYIKHFKNTYGPILMDKGVKKTLQGEFMEIAQSSKPITYVGLDSCIGVTSPVSITVKNKIGVHLVIPFDEKMKKIYTKRVQTLQKVCGNSKLIICGKTSEAIEDHLDNVKQIIFPKDERPDSIKWLSEKTEDGVYTEKTDSSGIVTV